MHVLERSVAVPVARSKLFPFFADARNLERLTPPSLRFEILTPGEIRMEAGATIDYRLRVSGFPVRWRTVIELWEPPFRFIDVQTPDGFRTSLNHPSRADPRGGPGDGLA